MDKLLNKYNIKHILKAPYNPSSNGRVKKIQLNTQIYDKQIFNKCFIKTIY